MIRIKTEKEIEIMRQGGQILSQIMLSLKQLVKPGISTLYLEKKALEFTKRAGVEPAFLGYEGFPAALCTSLNESVVHEVPSSKKILREGDILKLDFGIKYKGYYSDMALTVPVGQVDFETARLIRVTKKALKIGIRNTKIGNTTGDIGNAIERYVISQGFSVVKDLCGHGIGRDLHEDPQVLNFGKRRKGEKLKEGMVICIEPMVAMGNGEIKLGDDGFAWRTKDGSLAAHFEHTVAITKNGSQVLTKEI